MTAVEIKNLKQELEKIIYYNTLLKGEMKVRKLMKRKGFTEYYSELCRHYSFRKDYIEFSLSRNFNGEEEENVIKVHIR